LWFGPKLNINNTGYDESGSKNSEAANCYSFQIFSKWLFSGRTMLIFIHNRYVCLAFTRDMQIADEIASRPGSAEYFGSADGLRISRRQKVADADPNP